MPEEHPAQVVDSGITTAQPCNILRVQRPGADDDKKRHNPQQQGQRIDPWTSNGILRYALMSQLIALFLVVFLQSGRLSATQEPHRIAPQDEIERKKSPLARAFPEQRRQL